MITYKQRKDYAIVTGVLFFLGMLLYGFLSYSVKTWFLDGSANYKSISVTVAALLGEFFWEAFVVVFFCLRVL